MRWTHEKAVVRLRQMEAGDKIEVSGQGDAWNAAMKHHEYFNGNRFSTSTRLEPDGPCLKLIRTIKKVR